MRSLEELAIVFAALFLAFTTVIADVTTNVSFNAPQQMSFADSLMLQKRYAEAELEYERLASFDAGPLHHQAIDRMMYAALATGKPDFALNVARAWEDRSSGEDRCHLEVFESKALYQMENFPAVLRNTLAADCSIDSKTKSHYLKGLSDLRLRDWDAAPKEFNDVPATSSLYDSAVQAAAAAPQGRLLAFKSPSLAAMVSAVIPGTGYAYADRPQTAMAALVVNGLFIGGTYSAAKAGQIGVAAVLAFFSLAWYSGAVYGSAQAAERENRARLDRFIHPFEIQW